MEQTEQVEKVVKASLTECLDCFWLVGFTIEGNQIAIIHTPTDMHVQAVNRAAQEVYEEVFIDEPLEAEVELEEWEEEDD